MKQKKVTIIITHERSGTHLVINAINFEKNGDYHTIGYIPNISEHNLKNYKHTVYRDIISFAYLPDAVCKSHHQVEFVNEHLDYLFEKYNVIYVQRNIKDTLTSYYHFVKSACDNNFPNIDEWIFSKPNEIGKKFLTPYASDPHIIIEPENYIHRWQLHINGWMKHKNNMLVLNYEDILNDYAQERLRIEDYICKKISPTIPDKNNKNLPNYKPRKGNIGSYKECMSEELIQKIDNYILTH